MTSTVFDAAVCLLLVGASVGTLATATPAERFETGGGADSAVATLATTTTTVNYTQAPGARYARGTTVTFPDTAGPEFRRTVRGTLIALLATAATERVRIHGELTTRSGRDLASGVRRAVGARVGTAETRVIAVWQPYPDAPIAGRVTVGDPPPPRADVHAARMSVAARTGAGGESSSSAGSLGYGALARVLAERTVRLLFPPEPTRRALGSDYPRNALVRHRYLRVAGLLGADIEHEPDVRSVETTNAALVDELAETFEHDLRRQYNTSTAAARAVTVNETRIVVQRWSA